MGRKVQAASDVADETQDVPVADETQDVSVADETQDVSVADIPAESGDVQTAGDVVDPIVAEYGEAGPGPFRVTAGFKAMVGAQLCAFREGEIIDPLAGAALAAGGAPVEPV